VHDELAADFQLGLAQRRTGPCNDLGKNRKELLTRIANSRTGEIETDDLRPDPGLARDRFFVRGAKEIVR
jgi:hypothetical protein